jgi:hypothetical protein
MPILIRRMSCSDNNTDIRRYGTIYSTSLTPSRCHSSHCPPPPCPPMPCPPMPYPQYGPYCPPIPGPPGPPGPPGATNFDGGGPATFIIPSTNFDCGGVTGPN